MSVCVLSTELIIRVPLCVWFLQTQSPEEERELCCSQAVLVALSGVVRPGPADPNVWDVLGTQRSGLCTWESSCGGAFASWNAGWFGWRGL